MLPTQVAPCLMGEPEAHVMQSVAVAPEQVLQLESHDWQRKLLSAYVPPGQALTHELLWKTGALEAALHDVQLPATVHVLHVDSQSAHVWPSDSRYCPRGHEYVHVPATLSKVAPAKQAVQPLAVPSLQSPHEESQALQKLSASAYLPLGGAETHVPSS